MMVSWILLTIIETIGVLLMSKIIISSAMRCKNKQSFFSLHQMQTKVQALDPSVEVEFHVLWDTDASSSEKQDDPIWASRIDTHIKNLHSYDRQFFKDYVKGCYGDKYVNELDKHFAVYILLMGHYLRRIKMYDYYVNYDDDVVINDDFSFVFNLIQNQIPVLMCEPMNTACDKVMFNKFIELYGSGFVENYRLRNPEAVGCNGGFQGIDLAIYDHFLSADRFDLLLSMFELKSHIREDGTEIWGSERFFIDTQQQSFFSLMNIVLARNTPHILDVSEYYVVPNWGEHPVFGKIDPEDELQGWGLCLKSKISHFIGHTRGQGKPKVFLNIVDKYLMDRGFEV